MFWPRRCWFGTMKMNLMYQQVNLADTSMKIHIAVNQLHSHDHDHVHHTCHKYENPHSSQSVTFP